MGGKFGTRFSPNQRAALLALKKNGNSTISEIIEVAAELGSDARQLRAGSIWMMVNRLKDLGYVKEAHRVGKKAVLAITPSGEAMLAARNGSPPKPLKTPLKKIAARKPVAQERQLSAKNGEHEAQLKTPLNIAQLELEKSATVKASWIVDPPLLCDACPEITSMTATVGPLKLCAPCAVAAYNGLSALMRANILTIPPIEASAPSNEDACHG